MSAADDRRQFALAMLSTEISGRISDAMRIATAGATTGGSPDGLDALTACLRVLEGAGFLADVLTRLIDGRPVGVRASGLTWLVGEELAADIDATQTNQNTRG